MKPNRHPFGSLILPNKTPQLRQLIAEIKGPRKQEFEELYRRFGISHLEVWLIHTAQGPLVMGTFEAESEHALGEMSASGARVSEQLLDWHDEAQRATDE
jgi:hypothetical protein